MRKRRIRMTRSIKRRCPRSLRALQPLRAKALRSGLSPECRTYVTETHYEL